MSRISRTPKRGAQRSPKDQLLTVSVIQPLLRGKNASKATFSSSRWEASRFLAESGTTFRLKKWLRTANLLRIPSPKLISMAGQDMPEPIRSGSPGQKGTFHWENRFTCESSYKNRLIVRSAGGLQGEHCTQSGRVNAAARKIDKD